MFGIYLWRELRRRARQSSIIAIGLALGIGLVLTVTALSTGVKNAQGEVLHSLYGLDTNITVTQAPSSGSGGFGSFGFRGAFGTSQRPKAGTTVKVDTLRNVGEGTLTSSNLATVAGLHDVAAAAGGLSLTDTKISLKIPSFNSSGGGGGGFQQGGGGGTFGGTVAPSTTTVYGAQLTSSAAALGPLSNGRLTSGRTFTSADANANNALLDASYATANKLKVGSKITIAKVAFTVVGIVSIPNSDSPSDAYIPLQRAQTLASLKGDVNTIYVAASSASNISTVSREISTALPKATVTNSSNLASQLTGSLSNASSLANNLGKWLAIAVLAAAFLLASLLTGSAVTRRVREFGTLKALGWTSRRVVGQVVGESIVIGVVGGAVGVGLGFLGSALVGHYSGTLTAALGPSTGSATPGGARSFTGGGFPGSGGGFPGGGTGGNFAGRFGRAASTASHTVPVHLTASVTASAILAAVLLAIAGGLIAGTFGGWRAARLRPAMALARVE